MELASKTPTYGGDVMENRDEADIVPLARRRKTPKGHDVRSLGPSDSSDTGADMVGQGPLDDTSDRNRTGERMTIGTDRVVGPEEAGLGDGVDEAQEAERERPQR
jgi:hypothetical protein